ncbi:MAG: hypothetical protein WKF84_04375 [Pyrinomonadaceae bacterium]
MADSFSFFTLSQLNCVTPNYLNLVAYLVHIILERGDTRFQKARATVSSRARFWDELRTLMRRLLWESWAQMMEFVGMKNWPPSP